MVVNILISSSKNLSSYTAKLFKHVYVKCCFQCDRLCKIMSELKQTFNLTCFGLYDPIQISRIVSGTLCITDLKSFALLISWSCLVIITKTICTGASIQYVFVNMCFDGDNVIVFCGVVTVKRKT